MVSKPRAFVDIFTKGPYINFQHFSDASLRCADGSVFKVHKITLAAQSEYFRALFGFDINCNDVLIQNIESKTLDIILCYMYTGNIDLHTDAFQDILIASDFLLMDKLMQYCRSFALQRLTTSDCLSLLNVSKKLERLVMFEDCYRFVQVNFEDVVRNSGNQLAELDIDVLKILLSEKSLNIRSETTIWESIVNWVESYLPQRLSSVCELLQYLDTDEINETFATSIIEHPIVKENPFCRALKAKRKKSIITNRDLLLSFIAQPPISRVPSSLNIVVTTNGLHDFNGAQLYLTFDEKLDFWQKVLEIEFYPEVVLKIGHRVYLFSPWDNKMTAYDILTNMRIPMRRPVETRYEYFVTQINDCIYVLGGETETRIWTCIVERYDCDADDWVPVAPMREMNLSGAICLMDKMYALGHIDSNLEATMIMQVYNPILSNWTSTTPPRVLRQYFATIEYRGLLFVVGGQNSDAHLKNVEVYDPEVDSWSLLPDLPFAYFFPRCIVLKGKLYVFEDNWEGRHCCNIYPPVYWVENNRNWKIVNESYALFNLERYRFCRISEPESVKSIISNRKLSVNQWFKSPFLERYKSN